MTVTIINDKKIYYDMPFLHSKYFRNNNLNIKNTNTQLGSHSTWMYRNYLKKFKYNTQCWRKSWNRVEDVELAQRFFKIGVKMGYFEEVTLIQKPRPGTNNIGSKAI